MWGYHSESISHLTLGIVLATIVGTLNRITLLLTFRYFRKKREAVCMALDYTTENKVAVFILNRPQAMNALDIPTLHEFYEALIDFRSDPNLLAGIITGAGDEAFCTGIDIRSALFSINQYQDYSQPFPVTLMNGLNINKPLIAAVNGLALGGGLEIVLSCDVRIASENAGFYTPDAGLGLIPSWGGTQRRASMVRWCQSAEMLLTGKPIDAQTAFQMGLVNRVVPRKKLLSTAKNWAEVLCNAAPLGIHLTRKFKSKAPSHPEIEAEEIDDSPENGFICADDFYEGIKAFNSNHHPCLLAR